MLTFGMSEEQYDISAKNITYGKLIEKLIEDFVTREDAKMMMKSSNLPVSTTVQTTVNTILSGVAGPVPVTGTGTGLGNGSGSGQTSPIYTGDQPSPGSNVIKAKRLREKMTGTVETEGALEAINVAAGGEL